MAESPEPNWSHPPPMAPVTVDADAPDVEIRMRATRDGRGVVAAPYVLVRREPRDLGQQGAVIAWGRPVGTKGWPWILLTWMDHVGGGRYTSSASQWRHGWLAFDPELVVASSQPHRTTEYWLDQRARAIVVAVEAAGLHRPRKQS